MPTPELIHGDSKKVLPELAAAGYAGTAKLAYLDPPYNGGRTAVVGYKDERSPAAWSGLIAEVAAGCRELLRPDGSLWMHISDKYSARARMSMDDVFGEENYIGTVYWERTRRPSYLARHLVSTIDPILIYAKNAALLQPFTAGTTEPGKRVSLAHRGNRIQELAFPPGSVRFGVPDGSYPAGDHSTASIKVTLTADLVVEGGRNANDFCPMLPSRYSAARVQKMIEDGAEFSVPQLPFRPSYVSPGGQPKKAGSLWSWQLDPDVPTHEDAAKEQAELTDPGREPFVWAKPEGLLRKIIDLTTEQGDLVLDPFAGSGTTAVAAVQIERRCIAIEEREHLVTGLIRRRLDAALAARGA